MTQIQKLSQWFESQLGVKEEPAGSNSVIYNEIYYGRPVQGPEYPWCAAFIWAGFQACNLSGLYLNGGKSAYCPYIMDFALRNGQFEAGPYREGDILLYNLSGGNIPDHVGYCLGKSGGAYLALEGNCGDRVSRTRRSEGEILGALRPQYLSTELPEPEPEPEAEIKAGELVKIKAGAVYYNGKAIPAFVLERNWYLESLNGSRAVINKDEKGEFAIKSPIDIKYLSPAYSEKPVLNNEYRVKKGDTLWAIAKRELGAGIRYKELMELNGLDSDLIFPGQILKLRSGEES